MNDIEQDEEAEASNRAYLDMFGPPTVPTSVSRCFTFGMGQCHPVTGQSLADHYVVITGETINHCRATMLNHFGNNWAFDYDSPESANRGGWQMFELPVGEWPPSSDVWRVDESGQLYEAFFTTRLEGQQLGGVTSPADIYEERREPMESTGDGVHRFRVKFRCRVCGGETYRVAVSEQDVQDFITAGHGHG